ncbi:hypothetical protein DFP72DRAFT_804891 [Ephemerocybe angulata]|uniref:Uncharacterized protein n=1 Tax=Ephemerocybe angulata TaxID=980116 RepID=A0A8H6I7W4_9AGAR|nr:hypothetical protein DFP72DRAFT_804891 [Tulosesus angulatus]
MNLLSFPEELLERILEDVVLYSAPPLPNATHSSYVQTVSPEAPSRTLGPSPISTPATTPKSSPSTTRHVSPHASPTGTRPPSPAFGSPSSPSSSSSSGSPAFKSAAPPVNGSLAPSLAPLLTCRLLSRIALPLYYRVVQLKSRGQAARLSAGANDGRKRRAMWIRRLVLGGVWKEAGEVVRVLAELVRPPHTATNSALMPRRVGGKGKGKAKADTEDEEYGRVRGAANSIALKVLEITIDVAALPPQSGVLPSYGRGVQMQLPADEDAEVFVSALKAFAVCWSGGKVENPLQHIVLRKPQNVYLTQPRARSVISALARVVETADALETAFIAFRISDDPQGASTPTTQGSTPPKPELQQPGPITQLTSALASRPHLKSFATMLPSVWNEAVLRVSKNEALERVVLLGVNGMPVTAYPPQPPVSNGNGNAGRRPRLAVVLPPNPVERVYAASARGVDGYHPSNNPHAIPEGGVPSAAVAGGYGGGGYVPMGTGLFMNQARKHERLCELIRCGAGVDEATEAPLSSALGNAFDTRQPGPALPARNAGAVVSSGALPGPPGSTLYTSCSSWFATRFSSSGNGGSALAAASTSSV